MSLAADAFLDHLQDESYTTLTDARDAVESIYPHMQRIAHYRIDSPPLFVSRSTDGWKVSFACDPRTLINDTWTTERDAELVLLKSAVYPTRTAAIEDVQFWMAS